MIVNVKEIQDIIHAMPVGKAPGYDSVSNEHFKYANEKLHVDLFDNNNYRPIALATIASKLFESLILSRVSTFLSTCVNQFGSKKHHSTEMLIFLLKELFRHYIATGSSMYVTMLDASKAFDKVNHSKLIDRGCPSFIVPIFYYWYRTQKFIVGWCCSFSEFFTVSNGVKQGGILSPHHF